MTHPGQLPEVVRFYVAYVQEVQVVDESKDYPQGRPIRLDPEAASADSSLPAFIARPAGAPVYHGFEVLEASRTDDGWCFGTISDPTVPEGRKWGDAFVIVPDNTRAGIVWEVGQGEMKVEIPPEPHRWGVYGLWFTDKVHTEQELIEQLHKWLPRLKERYAEWARDQQ